MYYENTHVILLIKYICITNNNDLLRHYEKGLFNMSPKRKEKLYLKQSQSENDKN